MRKILRWARPWPTARLRPETMIRQGAWYPVFDDSGPALVELGVAERTVRVPRRLFEFRPERPGRFTVVARPRGATNPAQGTAANLGPVYAVCPDCGNRVRLPGRPDRTTCASCGLEGEVAWWETG